MQKIHLEAFRSLERTFFVRVGIQTSGRGPRDRHPHPARDDEPPCDGDGKAAEQAENGETALERKQEGVERELHRRASSSVAGGTSRNGRPASRFGPDDVPSRDVRRPIGRFRPDMAIAEPDRDPGHGPERPGGTCSAVRRKRQASDLQRWGKSVPKLDDRLILRESFSTCPCPTSRRMPRGAVRVPSCSGCLPTAPAPRVSPPVRRHSCRLPVSRPAPGSPRPLTGMAAGPCGPFGVSWRLARMRPPRSAPRTSWFWLRGVRDTASARSERVASRQARAAFERSPNPPSRRDQPDWV